MQNVILNTPPGYLYDEIHRKDIHIHEQQKKIDMLEHELARSKQRIEELASQLAKCSENGTKSAQGRYWSPEEHQRFLEGLNRYGPKDVKSISQHVGTRNATQVRTHAQKYFLRLEKEKNGEANTDASPEDGCFNTNKGEEESDQQEEVLDKDSNPVNNDNNTELNSEDRLSRSTSPAQDGDATSDTPKSAIPRVKGSTKAKSTPKKRKPTKRKSSSMTYPEEYVSIKTEPSTNARRKPAAPLPANSLLPTYNPIPLSSIASHTINMNPNSNPNSSSLCNKIIADTMDHVLSVMKNWTRDEYARFVEGLVYAQDEKDNNQKCQLIHQNYLPHFPIDDVIKCYSVLQGVAMKDSQQPQQIQPFSFPMGASIGSMENSNNEPESKRMRMMSGPTDHMPMYNMVPFPSAGLSDLRYGYQYQHLNNPMMRGYSSSYSYPDGSFFPSFQSPMDSNQVNSIQRSNQMDSGFDLSRMNATENDFDPINYS